MAAKKTTTKKVTTRKTTTRKNAAAAKPQPPKPAARKQPAKKAGTAKKKLSALAAAAKVLGEATEPMASKEMIEAMATKDYWTSPGGKTPHATLYAAIIREIRTKGDEARFLKTDRGRFALKTA